MTWARKNFNYAVGSGSAGEATPFHSKKKEEKTANKKQPLKTQKVVEQPIGSQAPFQESLAKRATDSITTTAIGFAPFEKRLIKI